MCSKDATLNRPIIFWRKFRKLFPPGPTTIIDCSYKFLHREFFLRSIVHARARIIIIYWIVQLKFVSPLLNCYYVIIRADAIIIICTKHIHTYTSHNISVNL